jgi:hypothetical protein
VIDVVAIEVVVIDVVVLHLPEKRCGGARGRYTGSMVSSPSTALTISDVREL